MLAKQHEIETYCHWTSYSVSILKSETMYEYMYILFTKKLIARKTTDAGYSSISKERCSVTQDNGLNRNDQPFAHLLQKFPLPLRPPCIPDLVSLLTFLEFFLKIKKEGSYTTKYFLRYSKLVLINNWIENNRVQWLLKHNYYNAKASINWLCKWNCNWNS